jgi:hypothetical protein
MRLPIWIGGKRFSALKDAKAEMSKLLSMPVDTVFLPGCQQFSFILETLKRHPEANAKIGSGVSFFKIIKNEMGQGHGWLIARTDGSVEGFGYHKCLRSRALSVDHEGNFRKACRREIDAQRVEFLNAAFKDKTEITCPVNGETITKDACHIHHEPPNTFDRLVEQFIAENSIDVRLVLYDRDGPPTTPATFADRALGLAWQQFHASHACLQAVSKSAHMKILGAETRSANA